MTDESTYRKKALGAWLGKAVGGTLGAPWEGCRGPLALSFYDPVPTDMVPNDDIDLQVVWACRLATDWRGVVSYANFSDAWLRNIGFALDEYGVAKRNLARGIPAPHSGAYDNAFTDGMGAAIRSEIWALLAPEDPATAARLARVDASVDHAGAGVHAEQFLAALESALFGTSDLRAAIDAGLAQIPPGSRLARAIADTVRLCDEGGDFASVRAAILRDRGSENFTDVSMNLSFEVAALLLGGGDFARTVCLAANFGRDTDCTGATVGAILGILDPDAILSAVREALLSGETQLIWTEIAGDVRMPDFEQVYRDVNVPSQDAHFDEAWNVVPEVVGCSFEVSEAERLWREARPGTRIEIPLELFEPEVKAADLEGLLYRDRLCFMTTNYWDSDADRIGNIHLAADSLNGIVILPGEVFSYNDAVGERTEERGYRWAGAYADGEVTTEIGGGICQVSSTLYCAAMYAQMKTTMRQNHWFPVSYLSMGYDATVSWGGPDYRFKNTRDYPVKLNVYYDDHSVTIEFWGTNVDGSHVSPWTTSNEVYDEQWGCLIGYSVTVIRNILDADDNLITQIQEPTGIYHLHDHEIDWPEAKLRQDAAGQ